MLHEVAIGGLQAGQKSKDAQGADHFLTDCAGSLEESHFE